ncbi:MAG: hypothetical protein ACK5X3_23170 [Pseudomonadota bacterium]|jgi:hypothetical protein
MTDTTNGWPGKPGVPLNPERGGWHWLSGVTERPAAFEWLAHKQAWLFHRAQPEAQAMPPHDFRLWTYLGPVLTPEEATARREGKSGEHLSEAEQERDEFFNRLGRITEYLDLPVDATAQRIIETICERVENEREACASVEVRVIVPEGAETWTPLEAWEEAIIAFDEAFRYAIRAAAGEDREP